MKAILNRWGKLLGIAFVAGSLMVLVTAGVASANDYYWVPGSTNGSGNLSGLSLHLANTDGGSVNASLNLTATDSIHFTANSFNATGQTVTVNGSVSCLNMDWTGATNNPTLAYGSNLITASGNVTFIGAMLNTGGTDTGKGLAMGASPAAILITDGLTISGRLNTGNVILGDNLRIAGTIRHSSGEFNLNGFNITSTSDYAGTGTASRTLTLGNSVCYFSSWGMSVVTNLVITNNTAIINISGAGGITTGNISFNGATLNLNGSSHTISGNFTCATFGTNASAAQTITFTAGEVITANLFSLNGTSGHQHTLTAAGGYTLNTSSVITTNYVTLKNCTATNNGIGYGGSVDNGGNTNWFFPLTVTTRPVESLFYDKDGICTVTLNGTPIQDMGGNATAVTWAQWGTSSGNYTQYTTNTTYSTTNFTGNNLRIITATMVPGATYHYRYAITAGTNTTYGADGNFTLVQPVMGATPVVFTTAYMLTLSAVISNMGNASNTTVYFDYGVTPAMGTTSPTFVVSAVGSTPMVFVAPTSDTILYYRSVANNGGVLVYGATGSVPITTASGSALLKGILRILLAAIILVSVFLLGVRAFSDANSADATGQGSASEEKYIVFFAFLLVGLLAFAIVNLLISQL